MNLMWLILSPNCLTDMLLSNLTNLNIACVDSWEIKFECDAGGILTFCNNWYFRRVQEINMWTSQYIEKGFFIHLLRITVVATVTVPCFYILGWFFLFVLFCFVTTSRLVVLWESSESMVLGSAHAWNNKFNPFNFYSLSVKP